MKTQITLLCPKQLKRSGLLYFYSLFPFLRKKFKNIDFYVTNSLSYCLNEDKNKSLIVVRYLTNDFKFHDIDTISILSKLRDRYKKLAIFDDGARTSIDFPHALPLVDAYFHSQLFRDKKNYKRPVNRGQLYSEYYADSGVDDGNVYRSKPLTDDQLSKVYLAWNIGAGSYPRNNTMRRLGLLAAKFINPKTVSFFYSDPSDAEFPNNEEKYDVQARFSIQSIPTIAYQRELVLEKVGDRENVLTELVRPSQYKDELTNSKIVLSPFGWGEVCFRDFEAVLNGALLLKPDMSHIETWPDIYRPYETYVPFQWNCEDMVPKIEKYLKDDHKRRKIVKNAFDVYKQELEKLDKKVDDLVDILHAY